MYDLALAITDGRLPPRSSSREGDDKDELMRAVVDSVLLLSLLITEDDNARELASAILDLRSIPKLPKGGKGDGSTLDVAGSVLLKIPNGGGDGIYEPARAAADIRLLPRL